MSKPIEELNQRPTKLVLKSAAWLMSGRALRLILGAGVYVLVARYLRPADFGLLVSALALMSILEIAGRLGLNQVVLRDIIRRPETAGEAIGTVLVLRLLCAFGGIAFATAIGFVIFPDAGTDRWVFSVAALALAPAAVSSSLVLWFQSRTDARTPVLTDIAMFVLGNAARVFLLATGGSLLAFALVPVLSHAVRAMGLLWAIQKSKDRVFTLRPNLRLAQPLLRDNWPLLFMQFAGVVYLKIDQVMLAALASTREAGVYGAALRISEVWYFVPAALCISIKPTLTRLRDKNHSRYLQVLQGLFSVLTLMALSVAIPMTFLAPTIVDALFGSAYSGASVVLAIHVWAALFVFWRRAQSEWMINEGHLKFGLCRTLLGASTNIALNLVLIPSHGAAGAAMATLISCFLTVIPTNLMFTPARPILALQLRSLLLAGLLQHVRRWTRPASATQSM